MIVLKAALLKLEGVLVSVKQLEAYVIVQSFNKAGITIKQNLNDLFYLHSLPEFASRKNFFKALLVVYKLGKIVDSEKIILEINKFTEKDEKTISIALRKYEELYSGWVKLNHMVKPLAEPGSLSVFLQKKKFKVAVYTNLDKKFAEFLLDKYGIQTNLIICKNDKPFGFASKQFKLKLEECFIVTDSVAEVQAGKKIKCTTIGAITGVSTREQLVLEKPDFMIQGLKDLQKILESYTG
ncbi:HAD family hydrolase [Candidatus Micrarchaeota archaeon]|nr:HAD family hydrolase [Candidatus Micrarchaeota archaeon]